MGFLAKIHGSVSKNEVVEQFRRHHDVEDLGEECWTDRIKDLDLWKIESIPVSKIYLYSDKDSVSKAFGEDEEEKSEKFAGRKTKFPAIIVEKKNDKYITIDGAHRARAAFLRGDSHMDAYVGSMLGC